MYPAADELKIDERDVRQAFKPGTSKKFKDVENLRGDAVLTVGDQVRVVIGTRPDFFDKIWDSAQENAEERIEEVLEVFREHGIACSLLRVEGVDLGVQVSQDQPRELYLYELEVLGFVDAPFGFSEDLIVAATGPAGATTGILATWLKTIGASGFLAGLLLLTVSVVSITIAGDTFSDIAMWLALGAIAIAVAYSIGKLKASP